MKKTDMTFADNYFIRYTVLPPLFNARPDEATGIIVIIPCFDDEFVFNTLDALENTDAIHSGIEVIINVNSGENASGEIVKRNKQIFEKLKHKADSGCYKKFRLLPLITENTVRKKAGVGYARKVIMDEALRRFAATGRPDGVIVSLDADTLVAPDYFSEIEKAALREVYAGSFTFQFRHKFEDSPYPLEVINACMLYEIYLRYYRLALKTFDFPFAIHTIGSCFAVRADTYSKSGGMPPRQGGEDFYFLQKAIKMQPVYEIKRQIVFPSPRISDRVPFGTGPSVGNIIRHGGQYRVYNFKLFGLLKAFYELFPAMASQDVRAGVPVEIMRHIGDAAFQRILAERRKYSSTPKAFLKRMYDHFDAFFVVKFLNTFDKNSSYPPVDVLEASKMLLNHYGAVYDTFAGREELYHTIASLDTGI
jgi:hypothetical protein